jgi:hypothetical protein
LISNEIEGVKKKIRLFFHLAGRRILESLNPYHRPTLLEMLPETAKGIIDEAITLFGGYGYFLEQEVERRYRDNRIAEIYEGTIQVQLNTIVRILKKLNPGYITDRML